MFFNNTEDQEIWVSEIAARIMSGDYPIKTVIKGCAASFWGDPSFIASPEKKKEYDNNVLKLTKNLIHRECILKSIPVDIFLEGAYMPRQKSTKLVYHSQFLPQLYRVYAERRGLPLQTTWEVKYKVLTDDTRQEEYREIAMLQNKLILEDELTEKAREVYKKLMMRSRHIKIVPIPKNNIAGYWEDNDKPLFVLSGCYDIVGAIGFMNFELDGKQEKFYFDYNIDTDKTKLTRGDHPTAYGQYPQQITYTKWCRACIESYYRPKLIGVKLDSEDDVAREKAEAELQEREDRLKEKARANES